MALVYLGLFLVVPVVAVFAKALEQGVATYWAAISDPMALAAIRLTVITAAIAVPLNTLFGLAASWAIAKFDFPGKNVLMTVIDLPFSVSPVISGMIFVLLFGAARRVRGVAHGARHQDYFRRAGDRPGHRVCHLPLRRT